MKTSTKIWYILGCIFALFLLGVMIFGFGNDQGLEGKWVLDQRYNRGDFCNYSMGQNGEGFKSVEFTKDHVLIRTWNDEVFGTKEYEILSKDSLQIGNIIYNWLYTYKIEGNTLYLTGRNNSVTLERIH